MPDRQINAVIMWFDDEAAIYDDKGHRLPFHKVGLGDSSGVGDVWIGDKTYQALSQYRGNTRIAINASLRDIDDEGVLGVWKIFNKNSYPVRLYILENIEFRVFDCKAGKYIVPPKSYEQKNANEPPAM